MISLRLIICCFFLALASESFAIDIRIQNFNVNDRDSTQPMQLIVKGTYCVEKHEGPGFSLVSFGPYYSSITLDLPYHGTSSTKNFTWDAKVTQDNDKALVTPTNVTFQLVQGHKILFQVDHKYETSGTYCGGSKSGRGSSSDNTVEYSKGPKRQKSFIINAVQSEESYDINFADPESTEILTEAKDGCATQ